MAQADDDDHADRIARMKRLCSALDEVQEESKRVNLDIATEARFASRAALKRKRDRERYRQKR